MSRDGSLNKKWAGKCTSDVWDRPQPERCMAVSIGESKAAKRTHISI